MTADTLRDAVVSVKRCPDCGARFGVDAAFCPFDGVALTTASWDPSRDALVGTTVDARYEVHEPLGEGGMGTVYKVRHVTLNRMFAMKVLRKDLAADGALAQRFVQEAKATAAIKHAGVVAITDFGVHGGIPYFVMEMLVGETLAARIRGRGPLAPRDAIGVAKRIAEALEASHAAGVIHRDLKPENVFLVGKALGKAAEEELRIVDFGAAKVIGGSKLTRPGVVFGTPYYMSPEQASGQPVDPRADVYSLGVLTYEMITGAVPFEADTYMGVLTKHMFVAPTKPSEKVAAGIQLGALEGVVMKALEKEPSARHASMRDLITALDDAMSKRPSTRPMHTQKQQRTVRMPDAPRVSTADVIERQVKKRVAAEEKHRKNKLVVIGVVATAATLVAGGVVLQMFGPKPSHMPSPRSSAVAGASIGPAPEAAGSSSAVASSTASATPEPSASASAAPPPVPPSASASASAPPRPSVPTAAVEAKPRPASRPAPPPAPVWRAPASCAALDPMERLNHPECWEHPASKH